MALTPGSFEDLLKEATGLDTDAIGRSTVARAVAEREHASGADGPDGYWKRLSSSTTELGLLIEAVVVPETWFFRHFEAFEAMTHFVRDECLRAAPDRALRLLSFPCSTGEEPYSMAMALIDMGVPPDRFLIDAIDISTRALSSARTGVYGKSSFRGADLSFRNRHFTTTTAGYELSDRVRARVRFAQGNLLIPDAPDGSERYDVVFCRNLLIYFDRPTQERAVTIVAGLLRPGGLLFVGPSETAVLLGHNLESAKVPMAFAFRKATGPSREVVVSARARPSKTLPPVVRLAAASKHTRASAAAEGPSHPPPAPAPPVAEPPGMDTALQLAEQGRFAEALRSCEEHIKRHGPTAEAFYVLGLVHDAGGQAPEADRCYRKALYLDPRHSDALVHLALLKERQGDRSQAQVLRGRLLRLKPHGRGAA